MTAAERARRAARLAFAIALGAASAACVPDTGRDIVEVSLASAGTGAGPYAIDGFEVTLDRADVAIGPLYLCATEVPDFDLCDEAHFEWLDPFVVDALDAAPSAVGAMSGTTGQVHTAFFDFGIAWYLTAAEPTAGPAALGGHSAILEGVATRGADVVRFSAAIDVVPIARGVVSVKGRDAERDVRGGQALTVRVDPGALLAAVDFDALLAEVVDPEVPVVVDPGSPAHDAIVFQMTAGASPAFDWQAP